MISSEPPIAPHGVPPAIGLAEADHVGHDAPALDGAAAGGADAGLDLVEDEHDAVLLGDRAYGLEEPGLGQHDAEVHHGGLHDEGGRRAALGDHRARCA